MNSVQVRDRSFKTFIPEAQILQRVREIGAQIAHDMRGERPILLSVLNGAFVFAADLARSIDEPLEISFVRLASYSGTQSTGAVKQLLGLNESIAGRTVIVVEDIIDSGLTMKELIATLQQQQPKALHIAALLVKPGNLKVDLKIDYCCFEIPNDFIVGYGLDYDGEGRNLRDIYVVE